MANLNQITLVNGVPQNSGTVSSIDALMADGGQATLGAKADAAVTAGASGSMIALLRAISRDLVQNVVLAAGNKLVGLFKISDGTNTAAVKAGNTAAQASDPALVVQLSPNSMNADGRALPANSAPVVLAQQFMEPCAAGATTTLQVATGAIGDYLDFVLVIPSNTSPGSVQIQDGANAAITVFPGGASSVSSTIPFAVPIKSCSQNGAWKVILGTGVTAIGVGNFS